MNSSDDLFDIIESEDNNKETGFVQDEDFMKTLDFENGFSDIEENEEIVPDASENVEIPDDTMDMFMDIPEENIEEASAEYTGNMSSDVSDTISDMMSDTAQDIAEDTVQDMIPDMIGDESAQNTEVYNEQDFPKDFQDVQDFQTAQDYQDPQNFQDEATEEDDDYYDEDEDDEALMVITEGTTITGSVGTDCSMLVLGTVNGDITCEGKLTISGKVVGNAFATDIFVNSQRIEGNLGCTGTLKISQGTVVIGNITAAAAAIGGAVKGDLDIQGPVILDSTAVIKGNIKAKSVQLINGAVLEGFCSVEYSNPEVDELFQ